MFVPRGQLQIMCSTLWLQPCRLYDLNWLPINATDELLTRLEPQVRSSRGKPSAGTPQQTTSTDVVVTTAHQETDMSSLSLQALKQEIDRMECHPQDTPNVGFSTLRAALDHHLVLARRDLKVREPEGDLLN